MVCLTGASMACKILYANQEAGPSMRHVAMRCAEPVAAPPPDNPGGSEEGRYQRSIMARSGAVEKLWADCVKRPHLCTENSTFPQVSLWTQLVVHAIISRHAKALLRDRQPVSAGRESEAGPGGRGADFGPAQGCSGSRKPRSAGRVSVFRSSSLRRPVGRRVGRVGRRCFGTVLSARLDLGNGCLRAPRDGGGFCPRGLSQGMLASGAAHRPAQL